MSDEIGVFVEGKFYTASDAIALSYNYTWQYGSQMREYPYQEYYRTIFYANAVIDGVMDSDADTDASDSKEQILGEAYALRAYAHFDLTNLYGKPYDPETAARTAPLPFRPPSTSNRYTARATWLPYTSRSWKTSKTPSG